MYWHKSQQKQMQSIKSVIWKTLYNNPAKKMSHKTCTIKPKRQILTMTIWIFELPTSNNINYQVSPQYHTITYINNGIISYTGRRAIFCSQPIYPELCARVRIISRDVWLPDNPSRGWSSRGLFRPPQPIWRDHSLEGVKNWVTK